MLTQAIKYAKLSLALYSVPLNIGNDDRSIAGLKSYDDGALMVGFQGTDNIEGLLTDVVAIPHGAGPLGRVHHGILESVRSIGVELSLLSPDVIYGHSLGAAQALLYAAMLCVEGRPPKAVYAFEPPKLSIDDKIKNLLADNNVYVFIMQNGNDIVPMLPPGAVWPWRHPGELTRIGYPVLPVPNIADHFISKVIKNIKREIKRKRAPQWNLI